jgi:hypothetical protein
MLAARICGTPNASSTISIGACGDHRFALDPRLQPRGGGGRQRQRRDRAEQKGAAVEHGNLPVVAIAAKLAPPGAASHGKVFPGHRVRLWACPIGCGYDLIKS